MTDTSMPFEPGETPAERAHGLQADMAKLRLQESLRAFHLRQRIAMALAGNPERCIVGRSRMSSSERAALAALNQGHNGTFTTLHIPRLS